MLNLFRPIFVSLVFALLVSIPTLTMAQSVANNEKYAGVMGRKMIISYQPGLFGQTRWFLKETEEFGAYSRTRDLALSHNFSIERAINPKNSIRVLFGLYETTIGNAGFYRSNNNFYSPTNIPATEQKFKVNDFAIGYRYYDGYAPLFSFFEILVGFQNYITPDSLSYFSDDTFTPVNEREYVGSALSKQTPFIALGFGKQYVIGQHLVLGYHWHVHLTAIYSRLYVVTRDSDYFFSPNFQDFEQAHNLLVRNRMMGLRPLTVNFSIGYLF